MNQGTKIALYLILGTVIVWGGYKILYNKFSSAGDKATKDENKDENKDEKKYIDEYFPLKKGMKGYNIMKVRAVLGLAPTQFFDKELEDLLLAKYNVKEVTKYNFDYFSRYITPNV